MHAHRRRWIGLLVAIGATTSIVARADAPPKHTDPDTQASRRHYDRGVALYNAERYADAAREFETARRIKTLPAFDYNIGRCRDRMEDWTGALDAYERYLAEAPTAPDAPEVRARVVVLRSRVDGARVPEPIVAAPAESGPTESASLTRRWWFWTAIGAVVVAAAAVGIGVAVSGGAQSPAAVTNDGTFTVRF